MVAALVVMTGHLLHIKGSASGFLIGSHLEKILSSGSFAVMVFFGLSGIALRLQTDKYGISFRWFIARLIRLMPVYWITLIPPIIGCYLTGVKIDYPSYGFFVAALGLQAIANNLYLPPVNGPLWSLSVEIYLSASLLLIGRTKSFKAFFLLGFLILINWVTPGNPMLQGLPIFYFGYLLPSAKLNWCDNLVIKSIPIIIPVFVLLFSPELIQGKFSAFGNFILCSILASLIMTWCQISSGLEKTLLARFSQRSYSLYAVHFPLILFINKFLFEGKEYTSAIQVFVSIILVFLATEILFRFVERPSIVSARHYLSRGTLD